MIEDRAWVAAEAFVGSEVTIGKGAVVGARAAVFKNVEPWTVVGGSPAKFIKMRVFKNTIGRGRLTHLYSASLARKEAA